MKEVIKLLFFFGLAISIVSCENDTAKVNAEAEKQALQEELVDVAKEIEEEVSEVASEQVEIANEKALLEEEKAMIASEKAAEAKAVADLKKTPPAKVKKAKKKKKKPAKASKIVFEKRSYNFGTVNEGELITYQFFFQNKGKENLLIKNATATCGCTVPSYPKVPIEPEEESYIRISFNTKAKKGLQKPVVKVFTNARKAPYELYLEGTVIPEATEAVEEESNTEGGK